MAAFKSDPMAVLAAMGEQQVQNVSDMLDMVVAMMLVRFGDTSIVFTRDELMQTVNEFEIERSLTADGTCTVRVKPRFDDGQLKLPEID